MAVFSPAGWDTPTWAQATRGGRVPTCRATAYVADQRLRQRAGPRLPTACGSPVCGRHLDPRHGFTLSLPRQEARRESTPLTALPSPPAHAGPSQGPTELPKGLLVG